MSKLEKIKKWLFPDSPTATYRYAWIFDGLKVREMLLAQSPDRYYNQFHRVYYPLDGSNFWYAVNINKAIPECEIFEDYDEAVSFAKNKLKKQNLDSRKRKWQENSL